MAGERMWSASELEDLTPNERDAVVRAGFVVDPLAVAELVRRARLKADARIAATEGTEASR